MGNENKELIIDRLGSSLDQLRADIESHRRGRLLGPLVEDFTSRLLGLKNQGGMDVVSEMLEEMANDIENEINHLSSIPSAHFWYRSLLPNFLLEWRDPSSHVWGLLENATVLLKETVKRRSPRADIYRLAYYAQLSTKSYGLHRHYNGMPLPSKRFADMIHTRHTTLERLSKLAVMLYETVLTLDSASKTQGLTDVLDRVFDVLQYALKVNQQFPEADERFADVLEFGENPLRMFDSQLLAHCSDKLFGRPYEDIDCLSLLEDAMQWWSKIDGLATTYKFAALDRDGKRHYGEALDEKTRMETLHGLTMKELYFWNTDVPISAALAAEHLSYSDDIGILIEGHSVMGEGLGEKIKTITGTTVVSGRLPLSHTTVDIRGGFANVQRVDVSDSPELKSIFTPHSNIRYVAVKMPISYEGDSNETQYLRFFRELRVWSRMKHKHILPLLAIWTGSLPGCTTPAFISPWMSQGSMSSVITSNPRIPLSRRLQYLCDIANALEYMHYHQFRTVHGDVRADNVLVDSNRAFLCDFGLAKLHDGVEGFEKGLRGNWRWLAPEMFDVEEDGKYPDPSTESDMFSFGCLILEVLSGGLPYLGVEDNSGISKRSNDRTFIPYRPPSIPDGAHWFFCLNCWKQSPTLRPTAKEARLKMEQFLEKACTSEESIPHVRPARL